MRRFITSITLMLALLVLGACVSAPVQRQFDNRLTLPGVTFERTWTALIDVFGERRWTIANMDKASGFINTDWMSAESGNYLDCGKPGLNTESNRMGRFNVLVRADSARNGTLVTINSTFKAVWAFSGSGRPVDCLSTGILEGEIQTELRRRLGVGNTAAF